MFYHKRETEEFVSWLVSPGPINLVYPDLIMTTENHTEIPEEEKKGWQWHDEPPQEYLDWKEEQEKALNDEP